ncbi:c-type cytochrome biogenesis protein CcmI [Nitratireductor pacificus]|uniref:Cytochrome c-type biogenesis protein n=1 Tax=Nitratireductor pacificus pht-3B TaxID=391937 RepID=K2MGD6_9HYPH|nr:c-type cytochrome biogenesis protein CcmI [Nitratireductor pacificus]EKF19770.1 cytochrome c-type biogenesis protein [Nitratireductor pacificus pht-3B]
MLFWIFAAILTVATALAVMRPFMTRKGASAGGAAHDIEVYRDQLDELGRDVERGLIGKTEAEQARAEIGRRILKVSETTEGVAGDDRNRTVVRLVAVVAILAVPLVSWGLYLVTGSPEMRSQPLQARLEQDPSNASVDDLIARAEAHLANNPQDVRGWQVLGPIYMRLGRFADAETALRNIMRLSGESADLQASLGEVIVGKAQGLVTAEAEAAFRAALELEAGNPKAQFFVALARAQEGRMPEARAAWQALAAGQPEGSPWREAVAQALAGSESAEEQGEKETPPGPSSEEVAAAADMTPEDRLAMISGMVAQLDARLRDNPADADGWRRLIRSYTVLNRPDDARAALGRAIEALGADTPESAELVAFAAGLGIAVE